MHVADHFRLSVSLGWCNNGLSCIMHLPSACVLCQPWPFCDIFGHTYKVHLSVCNGSSLDVTWPQGTRWSDSGYWSLEATKVALHGCQACQGDRQERQPIAWTIVRERSRLNYLDLVADSLTSRFMSRYWLGELTPDVNCTRAGMVQHMVQ